MGVGGWGSGEGGADGRFRSWGCCPGVEGWCDKEDGAHSEEEVTGLYLAWEGKGAKMFLESPQSAWL